MRLVRLQRPLARRKTKGSPGVDDGRQTAGALLLSSLGWMAAPELPPSVLDARVVVLSGPPCSGKTNLALKYFKKHRRLSVEDPETKLSLHKIKKRIQTALRGEEKIIIDDQNATRALREYIMQAACEACGTSASAHSLHIRCVPLGGRTQILWANEWALAEALMHEKPYAPLAGQSVVAKRAAHTWFSSARTIPDSLLSVSGEEDNEEACFEKCRFMSLPLRDPKLGECFNTSALILDGACCLRSRMGPDWHELDLLEGVASAVHKWVELHPETNILVYLEPRAIFKDVVADSVLSDVDNSWRAHKDDPSLIEKSAVSALDSLAAAALPAPLYYLWLPLGEPPPPSSADSSEYRPLTPNELFSRLAWLCNSPSLSCNSDGRLSAQPVAWLVRRHSVALSKLTIVSYKESDFHKASGLREIKVSEFLKLKFDVTQGPKLASFLSDFSQGPQLPHSTNYQPPKDGGRVTSHGRVHGLVIPSKQYVADDSKFPVLPNDCPALGFDMKDLEAILKTAKTKRTFKRAEALAIEEEKWSDEKFSRINDSNQSIVEGRGAPSDDRKYSTLCRVELTAKVRGSTNDNYVPKMHVGQPPQMLIMGRRCNCPDFVKRFGPDSFDAPGDGLSQENLLCKHLLALLLRCAQKNKHLRSNDKNVIDNDTFTHNVSHTCTDKDTHHHTDNSAQAPDDVHCVLLAPAAAESIEPRNGDYRSLETASDANTASSQLTQGARRKLPATFSDAIKSTPEEDSENPTNRCKRVASSSKPPPKKLTKLEARGGAAESAINIDCEEVVTNAVSISLTKTVSVAEISRTEAPAVDLELASRCSAIATSCGERVGDFPGDLRLEPRCADWRGYGPSIEYDAPHEDHSPAAVNHSPAAAPIPSTMLPSILATTPSISAKASQSSKVASWALNGAPSSSPIEHSPPAPNQSPSTVTQVEGLPSVSLADIGLPSGTILDEKPPVHVSESYVGAAQEESGPKLTFTTMLDSFIGS